MRIYSACELRNTPLPKGFDFNQLIVSSGTGLIPPKSRKFGGERPRRHRRRQLPHKTSWMHRPIGSLSTCGVGFAISIFPSHSRTYNQILLEILPLGDPLVFVPGQLPLQPGSLSFPSLHHTEGNCADEECS